jgi:hypothetical protein
LRRSASVFGVRTPGEKKILTLEGRDFVLEPFGGGNNVHYRYILDGGGWKVYIHHNPEGGIQPVRVRLGFEALCGRSLFDVHAEFMDWLADLGFCTEKETISRVDLQVSIARPFEDFGLDIARRHVVKRAIDSCLHESSGGYTSYAAGSEIRANFYDKKRQLLETQDELGLKMIAEFCFDGEIPDHLTRIEFQIKRAAPRAMNIDTIKDLKESEASSFMTVRGYDPSEDDGDTDYRNAMNPGIAESVRSRFAGRRASE